MLNIIPQAELEKSEKQKENEERENEEEKHEDAEITKKTTDAEADDVTVSNEMKPAAPTGEENETLQKDEEPMETLETPSEIPETTKDIAAVKEVGVSTFPIHQISKMVYSCFDYQSKKKKIQRTISVRSKIFFENLCLNNFQLFKGNIYNVTGNQW